MTDYNLEVEPHGNKNWIVAVAFFMMIAIVFTSIFGALAWIEYSNALVEIARLGCN